MQQTSSFLHRPVQWCSVSIDFWTCQMCWAMPWSLTSNRLCWWTEKRLPKSSNSHLHSENAHKSSSKLNVIKLIYTQQIPHWTYVDNLSAVAGGEDWTNHPYRQTSNRGRDSVPNRIISCTVGAYTHSPARNSLAIVRWEKKKSPSGIMSECLWTVAKGLTLWHLRRKSPTVLFGWWCNWNQIK